MHRSRILKGWSILIVMAVFMAGSSNLAFSESGRPQPKGKFVIGTDFDFSNIDPNKTNPGVQTGYVFQALVHSSVIDYKIQPDLAESWKVIAPQTWQFNIRKGVTFHNGQPLTSADVQYSFYRQMGRIDRRFPGANRGTWRDLVDRIDTPDDYTAVIHTQHPDPSLLSIIRWLFVVPKSHIESVGDKTFSQNPVGTGPFQYKDRRVGESLTVEANPNFWNVNPEKGARGPARVQTVVYRTMPQEQTRIAAMKTGEIDGTSINVDSVKIFEGNKDFEIHYSVRNQSTFVMFNWREEKDPDTGEPNPLVDVRVRRALNHAVDVEALMKHYGTGLEYRTTLLGKGGLGYNPHVPFYEYNPEKAKQLMAEAGYSQGFKSIFFTSADNPPAVQALFQYLRDIGIQVEIKQTTPSVAMMGLINKSLYGMLFWGGGMGGPDPAATFFKTCISYDGTWAIHGKDDSLEALVQKQMREFDEEKRARIIDEVIQILWQDAWFIPLWEPVVIKVIHSKWHYGDSPTTGSFNLPNIRLRD